MRGGPLSDAGVVETLQPFIVTFWAQKDRKDPPAEVKALYEKAGRRMGSNVMCFVLDAEGKLLHAFNGFPDGARNPVSQSAKEMSRYFVAEIQKGAAKTRLSERKNAMTLPDVADGVRIFVRLADDRMFESYRSPVVEVVKDEGEWKLLARPARAREIDASKLARWLSLCYPPGFNEQLKPYDSVTGALTLKPAGKDAAILSGEVRLASKDIVFEGTLQVVVTYDGDAVELRGVVEGVYPRKDKMQGRAQKFKVVAAIESRP